MSVLEKAFVDLVYRGLERFGKYYSSYRGWVVNREDPEGYGRVKLKVPDVYGLSDYDYWAFPKNCYSGKDYGMQIIPQKGEMVWVEFEMGNPRRPIWTFGHFGQNQDGIKEKPDEVAKNYDLVWFQTPGGNIVELDDKSGVIRFTNASGVTFEIGDKINLGQKDKANEPAVKGDKNVDALKELKTKIDDLTQILITYSAAQGSAASGTTPTAGLAPALTTLSAQVNSFKAGLTSVDLTIEKTKSLKVTLD